MKCGGDSWTSLPGPDLKVPSAPGKAVLVCVLLSTIGSRGDVQPLVALASMMRTLGQEVRFCVPPDFRDWIESLGFHVTPIGPELRKLTASAPPPTSAAPDPERRRQLAEFTVATQFETIAAAAKACDIIVAATALQIAAPVTTPRAAAVASDTRTGTGPCDG